jgi:hypothetical protein
MKAFGLFGLATVLFAVLLLGPYLKRLTEGFTSETIEDKAAKQPLPASPPVAQKAIAKSIQEQTMELVQEIEQFNKLLEDPNITPATKEKIVKEKADKQAEIAKLTGETLPPPEIKKEGFEGVLSADLEKNSKASDFLQKATQSSL